MSLHVRASTVIPAGCTLLASLALTAQGVRAAAIPVLSFQWEKPAPDTVDGARDYLGPTRYPYIEPAAFLAQAGARIAYGSDWPVDPLDEWFAIQVGVTRKNRPDIDSKYRGPLGTDRGLSRAAVLRAITDGVSP